MILTVDIGNTTVCVCGVERREELTTRFCTRLSTVTGKSAGAYAAELREALMSGSLSGTPHGPGEEIGDVLFTAAKLAQMSGVDPEEALHNACDKFDRRFRAVEEAADKPLSQCSREELLALWKGAKSQDPS